MRDNILRRWLCDLATELVVKPIIEQLDRIERRVENIMATLIDLQAEVAALTTVEQSAIALLNGLSAQLKAAQGDPVAIQKVIDDLDAGKVALADAVSANTAPPVQP